MSHRSSCKCCYSAANVGCKARWDGSCGSCRPGVLPLLQSSLPRGLKGGEWSCGIRGGQLLLAATAAFSNLQWSLIQLWLIAHTDAVTALRAIPVQHFILCLLKVASFQLLFTSNNNFSLILNGKNSDSCLHAAMVETIRSQCLRLWKSQNGIKQMGK